MPTMKTGKRKCQKSAPDTNTEGGKTESKQHNTQEQDQRHRRMAKSNSVWLRSLRRRRRRGPRDRSMEAAMVGMIAQTNNEEPMKQLWMLPKEMTTPDRTGGEFWSQICSSSDAQRRG